MNIEIDKVQYIGWLEASVTIRLDALTDTFSFKTTSKDAKPLPFSGGESCVVNVDGEKILTGFVELINVGGNATSHDIDVAGRDRTADLLDSNIGSLSDWRPIITLKSAIEKIISHIGSDITVIDKVSPDVFVEAEDLMAPEPGQNAWDFIQSLARKKQVLLSSNSDGNILITKSSGIEVNATLQHKVNDDTNNVLSYGVSYDTTGRYNVYRITSQLNPLALILAGISSNSTIVNQSSQVVDDLIREGRQFVLIAENAGSNPIDRAKWEMNIRNARGKVYSATVHGFRNQTGNLWKLNELVQVVDEYADINSRMLVNSIQFSATSDGGKNTTLSLVEKNAYTLTLEEPVDDKVGIGLA